MKFFVDNNLSPSFSTILSELVQREFPGDEVVHLREKFDPATTDEEWMNILAKEGGWIIISADREILKNRHERQVWKDCKLIGFFVSKSWMALGFWDQAWRIVRWFPDIRKQAQMVTPGATFEIGVNPNGKFKVL